MKASVVREKRQTTIPGEVAEAAGIHPGDHLEWRFEDGELHARKMEAKEAGDRKFKRIKCGERFILQPKPSDEEILAAIRADREGTNR